MEQQNNIIYGPREDKRIKKNELVYDPIAGLTIAEAIAEAIIMSKKANDHVHAIINDVHMHITPKTSLKIAKANYDETIQAQYEAALRACEIFRKRRGGRP